jgi:anti-sigma B factor antagonist
VSLNLISKDFHSDPVGREHVITSYLNRKLSDRDSDEFESHYFACDECYEEVRATELLIYGLGQIVVERPTANNVAIVRFARRSELTGTSLDTGALVETLRSQNETRVLIDLSNVSHIDSTGLAMLIKCYCHAVKNRGALKLLNPSAQVKRVLNLTKIDSLMPTSDDEVSAIRSFDLE